MKPALLKGTRDFGPEEMHRRRIIFGVIEKYFRRYGFLPIETPAMERLDTLTNKYGEEGDKLLFKILNNGDFLSKVEPDILAKRNSSAATAQLSQRGLRYDLTIPFARFVAMNQSHLALPFKRFQIQPVWRADRPQKGRYQEFYQCDADVVGSRSVVYEADFIRLFVEVFRELGIAVEIQYNHRKILEGILECVGAQTHLASVLIALDKLDKIGKDPVRKELQSLGLLLQQVDQLFTLLEMNIDELKEAIILTASGPQGLADLDRIQVLLAPHLESMGSLVLKPSLARGLDYYTGTIFEVKAKDVPMGTIAAGGRYDDLTSIFGMSDVSGVGISFGAERIYDVMMELGLFAEAIPQLDLLLIGMDDQSLDCCFLLSHEVRNSGLCCDIYPDVAKLKKSMKYADRKNVRYVGIIGEEELSKKEVMLKDMDTGKQYRIKQTELTHTILQS